MAEIPNEMMTQGRPVDPVFQDDERLFRRFHPDDLEDGGISSDAVELPDMSVNRSKYGPPEWLLLDEEFEDWGVLSFRVDQIPVELIHNGQTHYTFLPQHVPHRRNYPHSEVWAFCEGEHVTDQTMSLLDPDLHLRWRQTIAWQSKIAITPDSPS